jgi:EAL domain-containing protein (putative c-di-GMP-specific phosphodiesterase class I)
VLILRALKAMGLYIAIDDFGTGYSSLSYLSKLPVDIIKIDRSFVNNITTSKEDSNIIQAIIAMAHGLELKTIAEGVEEAAQLTLLQAMNCYEIQGYYFSRPLSAAQFSDYLRNFNFNFATSRAN